MDKFKRKLIFGPYFGESSRMPVELVGESSKLSDLKKSAVWAERLTCL